MIWMIIMLPAVLSVLLKERHLTRKILFCTVCSPPHSILTLTENGSHRKPFRVVQYNSKKIMSTQNKRHYMTGSFCQFNRTFLITTMTFLFRFSAKSHLTPSPQTACAQNFPVWHRQLWLHLTRNKCVTWHHVISGRTIYNTEHKV